MLTSPRSSRLHIGLFGRRNVGKSSLFNVLTGQTYSIISDQPGTTTDPVYKSMELYPIGPVVFIDTAGIDDKGELGALRIKKTEEVLNQSDLALLVLDIYQEDYSVEQKWLRKCKERNILVIGVLNQIDKAKSSVQVKEIVSAAQELLKIPIIQVSTKSHVNIEVLIESIIQYSPKNFTHSTILGDLIHTKDIILLVAPQNDQAPKGRLILPQVQVIRDILDHHGMVLTVTEKELVDALVSLKTLPKLVVTDSQVFQFVNDLLPNQIPLTSFSILMARYKGDLGILVNGAKSLEKLNPGDYVLIAEACTHHALKGDIAREKIPQWLENNVGGLLNIDIVTGVDYPEDLTKYKCIIHCGGCMLHRPEMLNRLQRASVQQIPITNYGVAIACIHGILDRSVEIFSLENSEN